MFYLYILIKYHYPACLCIVFRTKYTSWRQATPYRRLGFVGDALSITLRRGQGAVSAPHHVTTLTILMGLIIILLSLYERQPSRILPPHRLTRSSPTLVPPSFSFLHINYPVGVALYSDISLYSDIPHLPDTYDYMIPFNIV